jgi:serine/threonine-protein kinase
VTTAQSALDSARLDRYRIERELGRGGMARVFLAEDLRHRRKVAIKVLHPEVSATLGPERFAREIELTAGLQHANILPLFDSGEAPGQLFYVMPFVDGETLPRSISLLL